MNTLYRSMEAFAITVECGSMSAASKQLNLSTSAISQQIQKLEQQYGMALLHRNTRKIALTEAGQIFYQGCKEALETLDNTHQQLSDLRRTSSGDLRIASPAGISCCGMLGAPLKNLIETNPALNVQLIVRDEPVDLVSERIDLALVVRVGALPDSRLIARKLVDWQQVLVATPEYLHAQGFNPAEPINEPEALQRLNYLCHEILLSETYLISRDNAEVKLSLTPRLVVNNMQTLIGLVKDGVGMARLPRPEIHEALQTGKLVALLPEWKLPPATVYAVTSQRESQPLKVRSALEALTDAFQQHVLRTAS